MLRLTFKQTDSELMVRAAATVLFSALRRQKTREVDIAELAERPQYGFTASANSEPVGPKLVRITDLKDGKIDWNSVPYCDCIEPEKYLLRENDILFARTGATTGKTHLVRSAARAVFASYLIRLRPKPSVDAGYLYAFFQSDNYWSQISEEKEGSAQPNVNGDKLASLKIPIVEREMQRAIAEFLFCVRHRRDGDSVELPELPLPLAEQRRIVAHIEELSAKIEKARELRKQAADEAEKLPATVLRTLQSSSDLEPTRLGTAILSSTNGLSRRPVGTEHGPIVLRLADVGSGEIDLSNPRRGSVSDKEQRKYSLQSGDLLFVRVNGSSSIVGRCVAVRTTPELICYNDHLIRVRVDPKVLDWRYASLIVNGPQSRAYIEAAAITTAGQLTVNQKMIEGLPIPLPPLSEQHRIVARLDELQHKTDSLKALQTQTSTELDALMPSILDRAFRGEL